MKLVEYCLPSNKSYSVIKLLIKLTDIPNYHVIVSQAQEYKFRNLKFAIC